MPGLGASRGRAGALVGLAIASLPALSKLPGVASEHSPSPADGVSSSYLPTPIDVVTATYEKYLECLASLDAIEGDARETERLAILYRFQGEFRSLAESSENNSLPALANYLKLSAVLGDRDAINGAMECLISQHAQDPQVADLGLLSVPTQVPLDLRIEWYRRITDVQNIPQGCLVLGRALVELQDPNYSGEAEYWLRQALDSSLNNRAKSVAQSLLREIELRTTKAAPDFSLGAIRWDSASGVTNFELNIAENRGKFVLLKFGGFWCGSCNLMKDEIKSLGKKYPEVVIMEVSSGSDPPQVFADKVIRHQITWPIAQVPMQGGIPGEYGVTNWPTTVVISPEGKIIGRLVGYEKGALEQLLKDAGIERKQN